CANATRDVVHSKAPVPRSWLDQRVHASHARTRWRDTMNGSGGISMSKMCIILALALSSALAVAEEPDAKTLFMRGRNAYTVGNFTEAADLFEKAFQLKEDPAILYNAAQAHRLAGDKKRALVLYQNYARLFGERENHEEVEKRIADLKVAIEAEQAAKT